MNIHFDFKNKTQFKIQRSDLLLIIQKAVKQFLGTNGKEVFISVFIVTPYEIKQLNQEHREKNQATTVLSFPQDEPLKNEPDEKKIVLGDLFICPEVIQEKNEHELDYYFSHGLYHLLGFSHQQMASIPATKHLVEESPSIFNSFRCAFRGVFEGLRTEKNLQIHYAIAALTIIAGFTLHVSRLEWLFIFFAIAMTVVMEIINTAIEKILDLTHPHYNREVRYIKDVFAAIVLISAFTAVVIGSIIFIPKIIALF